MNSSTLMILKVVDKSFGVGKVRVNDGMVLGSMFYDSELSIGWFVNGCSHCPLIRIFIWMIELNK